MAINTIVTPTMVSKSTAIGFKNHQKLVRNFTRKWEDLWENSVDGAKIGYTAQVRLEQRWVVNEGQALQQQAILNQTVPISINHQFQIAHGWSSADKTTLIEEVIKRYTDPAGRSMANKWDLIAGQEVYRLVQNSIGTPGVPISTDGTYTDGVALLRDLGVPDDLVAVVSPKQQSNLLKANFTVFNPQNFHGKNFLSGMFSGAALGVDEWNYDPNLPTHTTGSFTSSTPLVDGALQTGSTLLLKGMGTYSLVAGDMFTLAGVNLTNPISYVDSGDLAQFTIQTAVAGAGGLTVTINPPIIPSGPLQTVTSSPANNATVAFMGSTGTVNATLAATASKQGLIFNPQAFALVMADLPSPLPGAVSGRMNDKDTGIAMRYVDQYNIQTDQLPRRVDTIGGVGVIQGAMALRCWN